jgi:hypothetical protein
MAPRAGEGCVVASRPDYFGYHDAEMAVLNCAAELKVRSGSAPPFCFLYCHLLETVDQKMAMSLDAPVSIKSRRTV